MTTGRINQVTLLSAVRGPASKLLRHVCPVTAHLPQPLTHIDKCFHLPGHELSTKVKKNRKFLQLNKFLKQPDSLALSIFHYTDDVAARLMKREPSVNYSRFPVASELYNVGAWCKKSNLTSSSRFFFSERN